MTKDTLKEALNLGKIAQVGCVVKDLSESIKNYQETIGIGPFTIMDLRPTKSYVKDRPPDFVFKIGFAQLTDDVSLELIEIVSGEPYHRDFLAKHGEGVQHLGFLTEEYDQVLTRAEALGIDVLMWGEVDVPDMGRVRGAYLDTCDLIGVVVEIIDIKP
jgi:hypothetical protein